MDPDATARKSSVCWVAVAVSAILRPQHLEARVSQMTRVGLIAIVVIPWVGLAVAPVAAQTDSPVLRTPHGDADIQGIFTFRTLTPLQRPIIDRGASADLTGRAALTDEEAAAYEVA